MYSLIHNLKDSFPRLYKLFNYGHLLSDTPYTKSTGGNAKTNSYKQNKWIVDMLLSDKIDLQEKFTIRDEEGQYNHSIHWEKNKTKQFWNLSML